MKKLSFGILLLIISLASNALAQEAYRSASRYDYYTIEESVEVLVWIPSAKADLKVSVDIVFNYDHLLRGAEAVPGQMNIYPFPSSLFQQGENELTVSYNENGKWVGSDKVMVIIREHRYNAVKIDRVSGGLIVEGLPFYPFGFYNYSPVQPGLAEEESVKGFNMMSPYQKIDGKGLKERKAYMDRCAALGMKVNYNLLSLAGRGGVGSAEFKKLSGKKREKLLRKEIETFRDHPALLSWYISDEPVGQGVPPDSLVFAYNTVKELDPYHPVTVVFMTPSMASEYSHVMDIVMADPYVIPNGNIEDVGITAAMLKEEFFMEKPVWIVPQAFGGNEWWEREPTRQELRAMTYHALVNGAMGIQYFIRHGLNLFPKSTAAWNECGNMALEFAEITPFLYSPEPVLPVSSSEPAVSIKGYHHEGAYLLVAVNTENQPKEFSFTVDGLKYNGSVAVLFENRQIQIVEGKAEDIIDAYGSRVYMVRYKMLMSKGPGIHPKNIVKDPSFEDISGLGVPSFCYARSMKDRGATYFLDSRVSARGQHALRMTAPDYEGGNVLSFFPSRIEPGQTYTISIQARALPLKYREKVSKGFFGKICGCGADEEDHPVFSLGMGESGCEEYFITGSEWEEYSFSCLPGVTNGRNLISPILRMHGKGTAWFDLLQMYPDMELKSFVTRENTNLMVRLTTVHKGADIFYTIDGSEPTSGSTPFKGNFSLEHSATIKAAAFTEGKQMGYLERYLQVHHAIGRYVEYKNKYSSQYDAGYKDGLVDGILASSDFKDGKWQGFEGSDLDVTVHLREILPINRVILRFLVNPASWIFMPSSVRVLWSANGVDYYPLRDMEFGKEENANPGIHEIDIDGDGIQARYFRIMAKNIGVCPEGHPGAGGKAWLFTDEIIIE